MRQIIEPKQVGLSSDRLSKVSRWMRRYVDEGKLPFAMTLVARRGEVAFFDLVGMRDVKNRCPIRADTIMRFYSMTKPITTVAAMMLYEEGHFQLDSRIADFVPCLGDMEVYVPSEKGQLKSRPSRNPITFQHLMTHTSGFIYGFGDDSPLAEQYQFNRTDFDIDSGKLEGAVARLSSLPLAHEPGTSWHYGVSTDVLGYLVEVISGKSLRDYMMERIFLPLGMEDTDFGIPVEKLGRFSCLYEFDRMAGMRLADSADNTRYVLDNVVTYSGGGGLMSTMSDYYRFTKLLRNKGEVHGQRLLGRKTVDYMTCNHLPGDLAAMGQFTFNETTYEGIGFGLGFSVMLEPAKAGVVGSSGEYAWGGMASTAFWIDPTEDMTVIFLTQLSPSDAYPLRRELRVLTYQALVD